MNYDQEWKTFLKENSKMLGFSIDDILNRINSYENHTWIFFDTETMGFNPKMDQITEIGAMAVDPKTGDVVGDFDEFIKLDPRSLSRLRDPESKERREWDKEQKKSWKPLKKPSDVLAMTRYGGRDREYHDEQEILSKFEEFIEQFPNPLLVAKNARFDMHFVNNRKNQKLKKYPVLDTDPFIKHHAIPLLIEFANGEFEPFSRRVQLRAQNILDTLRFKPGGYSHMHSFSSSLGKVAPAFGIDVGDWHNALADVKMTIEMFNSLKRLFTYANSVNVNLRKGHEVAVARDRRRGRL
jgi:DNA polymerase III alpha subunit (gram-positive type)